MLIDRLIYVIMLMILLAIGLLNISDEVITYSIMILLILTSALYLQLKNVR